MSWPTIPRELLASAALVSVVLFFSNLLLLPWLVTRLPVDYFVKPLDQQARLFPSLPWLGWAVRIAKNLIGLVLLLAGVAMLFLPGQGVLTIVVALVMLEFPGKRRLERRLVRKPRVLAALNALRARVGVAPLEAPPTEETTS